MEYIVDKEAKYTDTILKHLNTYNIVHTGTRPIDKKYIYVLDNDKLIGALTADLAWDSVNLSEYYYSDIEVLQLMLSKVCELFRRKSEAIRISDNVLDRIHDFKRLGFFVEGVLRLNDESLEEYALAHYEFDILSNSNYEVLIQDFCIENYENLKKIRIGYSRAEIITAKEHEGITVVALEGNEFIGGVKAIIKTKSMYIDLMVVKEGYKGNDIGTKLIKLIELEAVERKLDTIYMVTVLAKTFYSKIGYTTVITKKNQPKGFNCYTLIKNIRR